MVVVLVPMSFIFPKVEKERERDPYHLDGVRSLVSLQITRHSFLFILLLLLLF